MDASDITKKIHTKRDKQTELWTRMDEDFDRWALRKSGYGTQNKTPLRDNDIEIISNAPRTFADGVQAILTASEMDIRVRMAEAEGEDKREDIGKLERLLYFAFEKADERLTNRGLPPLKDSLTWFSIVRGGLAGRFPVYKDGEDVIFDFEAYDLRWLVYSTYKKGILWSAHSTFHSPDDINAEYKKEFETPWYKPWGKTLNSYEVIDYWANVNGDIVNGILCNDMWLKEPESYPIMPVLINPVPTRPFITGKNTNEIASYGESIFAPNRDTDDLINEMATMWASHAKLLKDQPTINYYDGEGVQLETTAFLSEAVLNLPLNHNKLEPSPLREISPTLVNLVQWLDRRRESGSLPDISVGTPPPSGTLYNLIQESSNRVFNPQLRNLNTFYSNVCRLTEKQLLSNKIKVNVETEKDRKYVQFQVTPVDLKRPHIIKANFTARTPWTQLDTYQVADMAKRQGLPEEWIWDNILKVQDPKMMKDLSAIEMAEHSPKLAMVQAIEALLRLQGEKGKEKAQQLMRDMYQMTMEEEMGGAGTPAEAPLIGTEAPPTLSTPEPPVITG